MIHDLALSFGRPAPALTMLGDASSSVDMAGLVPETRKAFRELQAAVEEHLGFRIEPRSARRTCAEQAQLYAIGRGAGDARAKVTYAQGCMSWHVSGRAVDFDVYLPNGSKSTLSRDYTAVGELAESLGWTWGGRFSGFGPNGDEGHVQWPWTADGQTKLSTNDICPNPAECVDVPATFDDPLESFDWTTAGLIGAGLVAAAGIGIYLGNRASS